MYRLGQLSFFSPLDALAHHAPYYSRKAEVSNRQIEIRLHEELKASALLAVLSFITNNTGLVLDPKFMTLYSAVNIIQVAAALKLDELQKRLLSDVLSQ